MDRFETARDAAYKLRPDQPLYCFRPSVLRADALAFKSAFPGRMAYAVKTNGEPLVLQTLADAGVDCFDVASPAEFAAARAVAPKAELLYMHPVKAQSDIRLALETYGIRVIAIDHEDEIAKIVRIVRALDLDPEEITLFVRLAQSIFRPRKVTFPCPQCGLQRHDPDAVHCKACGHVLNIPDGDD